jgi:dynein heavy chain, axonemal
MIESKKIEQDIAEVR